MLPEADVEALGRVLDAMTAHALDPAARAALLAPDDDEPLTEAERAGMTEAEAALEAGDVVDVAALRAELAAKAGRAAA